MLGAALTLALLQAAVCPASAANSLRQAEMSVRNLDVAGAIAHFDEAAGAGCRDGAIGAAYLRGLQAARAAYAQGGSPASLAPVDRAIAELEAHEKSGNRLAEIAHVMLMAAAAAAQSERDDMATFLEHARSLEQRSAGGRALSPGVSEVAGDLWLQVHRFDAAREAYRAASQSGPTPATRLGLARVAARQADVPGACTSYRGLLQAPGVSRVSPAFAEAQRYVDANSCPAR